MSPTPPRTILLAAGGTGGHIFPAVATGEALAAMGYSPILVSDARFAGMKRNMDAVRQGRVTLATVAAASPSGNLPNIIRAAGLLMKGTWQALRLIRREKPLAVAGFGGYPSFPTLSAALLTRTPVLLHEQNALLGKANAVLAPYARLLALTFPKTAGIPARAQGKTELVGAPVREAVRALNALPYPAPDPQGPLELLVTGGSLGAHIFADLTPEALALLPEALRRRIRLVQQCRAERLEATRARYAELGIASELAPFFDDMPQRLARAHLVIARAGASTLCELMVAGRPAILVPYPHATGRHQHKNADNMVIAGGAWLLDEQAATPQALADMVEALLQSPAKLATMAQAARQAAMPDAAENLAKTIVSLAEGNG